MRVTTGAIAMSLNLVSPAQAAPDEHDVIPAQYRGVWVTKLADCKADGADFLVIDDDHVFAYESTGRVLIASGDAYITGPAGQEAREVQVLLAWRSEGEVSGIGKLRLIRAGEKLYSSNPEEVPESKKWSYPNVRCPE